MKRHSKRNRGAPYSNFTMLVLAVLLGSCASYGPYHANTATEPSNSIRGPADGRYKMAFVEFGDQGSPLDNSQRKAALEVIHKAERPLLFVYIHGWQNNATSSDVCRFEHFLDTVSSFPEFTGRKINVIGVYIGWRGKDLTAPGLNFLTFWSRKSAGGGIAAANSCLATIEELAVAAREPGKDYHHTVLLAHSFGALVLGNTISHSILGSIGKRCRCPGTTAKRSRKTNFIPIRPATINTSSITRLFRLDKAARRRVCERLRTGPSKPISNKTIPIFHFTRASTTMVMKRASVAMGITVPVTSIHRREKNSGGGGNLSTLETLASPVGSCACLKTLFGVTEVCGATTRLRCSARSFAWNSRCQPKAKWLLPSR